MRLRFVLTLVIALAVGSFNPQAATIGIAVDNLNSSLVIFDADEDTLLDLVSLPAGNFLDCTIAEDGERGWVSAFVSETPGQLWEIDLTGDPPGPLDDDGNPVDLPDNPAEDTTLTPDGRFLIVCDGGILSPPDDFVPPVISVVDTATRLVVESFEPPIECTAVEACSDGTVLIASTLEKQVRKLTIDGEGGLSDSRQSVFFDFEAFNVICSPGAETGVAVVFEPAQIHSFTLDDMARVDVRNLSNNAGVAAALSPTGDRLFARSAENCTEGDCSNSGAIDVFVYDPLSGAIGVEPDFVLPTTDIPPFFGVDTVATHPTANKFYVPRPGGIDVFVSGTGEFLTTIGPLTIPGDGDALFLATPAGICLGGAPQEIPLPRVTEQAEINLGAGALAGASLSAAGNLDADGFDDFIAGAPGLTLPGEPTAAGGAVVFLGSDVLGERIVPDILFTGITAHERLGSSVAGDFDFNGDGTPDLLIGAEQVDRSGAPVPVGNGRAYLIFFDPDDYDLANPLTDIVSVDRINNGRLDEISGIVFTGAVFGDAAGFSVDGGGRTLPGAAQDLAIGAPLNDELGADSGAVYVVFGSAGLPGTIDLDRINNPSHPLGPIPGLHYHGAAAGDQLGYSVAWLGDVLGGPAPDLAMGAPFTDLGVPPVRAGGPRPTRASDTRDPRRGRASFGRRQGVAAAGPGQAIDSGTTYVGSVEDAPIFDPLLGIIEVCVLGTPEGGGTAIRGESDLELLGTAVGSGGDNRVPRIDGFRGVDPAPDLLIGGPGFGGDAGRVVQTVSRLPEGKTLDASDVGDPDPLNPDAIDGVIWTGLRAGDRLGSSVSGGTDLTDNGFPDVLLGAPLADRDGLVDTGSVVLIAGRNDAPARAGLRNVGNLLPGEGAQLKGTRAMERAGAALAATGDLDGAGASDAVVGSPGLAVEGELEAGGLGLLTGGNQTTPQPPNRRPTAVASASPTLECSGGQASTTLDGSASFDPDHTDLLYVWYDNGLLLATGPQPTVTLPLGVHGIELFVTDPLGAADVASLVIMVEDTQPPTLTPPADILDAQCVAVEGTPVDLGAPTLFDACCGTVGLAATNDAPALFGAGTTLVTWTATDCNGLSSTATQSVTVTDTGGPGITVTATPDQLWPDHHKMVAIELTVEADDACSPVGQIALVSVTSSEPDDAPGPGDGATVDDIQGARIGDPDFEVLLRAETGKPDVPRVYTITYEATDAAGNTAQGSAEVRVFTDRDNPIYPPFPYGEPAGEGQIGGGGKR